MKLSSFAKPALLIFSGCAALLMCVLFACAANAVFWSYNLRTTGATRNPETVSHATPGAQPFGEVQAGERLFKGRGTCSACHSLEPNQHIVGPSLAGVATRAKTRQADTSAEAYLYASITTPNAYVVEGYLSHIMPEDFADRLTSQELADLVAYLATLQ